MEKKYNVSEMSDKEVVDIFMEKRIRYWRTKDNEVTNKVVIEKINSVEIRQGMVVVTDGNNQICLSFRHATMLLNGGNVKEDAGYGECMYWALN